MSDAALVDEIYLACLARYPTGRRTRPAAAAPAAAGRQRRSGRSVEDVFWGLMSSREFLFNH